MRRAALLLALTACNAPPPEQPPAEAVAPFVRTPETFERDPELSETVAVEGVLKGVGKGLCSGLLRRDPLVLKRLLAEDFRGRLFAAAPTTTPAGEEWVSVAEHPPETLTLDAGAFTGRLLSHVESFTALERCKLKPDGFKLASGHQWAWARLRLELAGRGAGAHGRIDRAEWTAELVLDEAGWRLRRVLSGSLSAVTAAVKPFSDVSAEVGIGFRHSAVATENHQDVIDFGARETVGGVAVLDWDRDGFDDVLAWHRQRAFLLFRNDGAGGFEQRADLLPPADVGYFQLAVDLDGDGWEEVVSSEVVGCTGGVARFALYTRVAPGGDLQRVPGGLPFRRPCRELRAADLRETIHVAYQHVAPQDVDGDGDLDLFVSGYSGRHSRRAGFNLFEADDGERDLLFVNQGGLRFREESRARGIEGTRWTYLGGFLDFDEDGDADLYTANDYGPNRIYLNDGAGHFTPAPRSPLTRNSQSMGLTVADFDGDLDFDFYVSNMYSYAGNRIVPLAEGTLPQATYEALLGSAAGNWMFVRDGPGRYSEHAADWGVADAGWAWGQVAADFDNDGDRDLYVANGMTTHSTLPDDF